MKTKITLERALESVGRDERPYIWHERTSDTSEFTPSDWDQIDVAIRDKKRGKTE